MHLKETLGKRDPSDSDRMRTHYAEADNELHHLLIMESLGVSQMLSIAPQSVSHHSTTSCPHSVRTLKGR